MKRQLQGLGLSATQAQAVLTLVSRRGWQRIGREDLCALPGVGGRTADKVLALVSVAREVAAAYTPSGEPIGCGSDVYRQVRGLLDCEVLEKFVVLLLNANHATIDRVVVGMGGATSVEITPMQVFRPAVVVGAAAIILVHNHPSGDPEPSPDDCKLTQRMVEAGKIVDVPVLDHLVIGNGRYVSFGERGLL